MCQLEWLSLHTHVVAIWPHLHSVHAILTGAKIQAVEDHSWRRGEQCRRKEEGDDRGKP